MKQQCECCGTCCRNGGPPLHSSDIGLIRRGVLKPADLVTVRRGEPVLPPMAQRPVPAATEWIKIQGCDGGWCCRFLNQEANTCMVYADRPVSCRTLKCWDPSDILAMAGRELLCREDILSDDDPLLPLVRLHEQACPVPDLAILQRMLEAGTGEREELLQLTRLVETDLQLRLAAVHEHGLTVALELFYFGRPLFQVFQSLGITVVESSDGLQLGVDRG